ncbi:Thiamine-phosphate synthase [Labrenzia sp. THAF82]|uniref:thiamine phosphate synthase n=1 Tax=Labrenzia sp. THAF82 TaxID=2587861 RepID=UPI001268AAA0|nr:thiamine phosphate synthase [Labrenzia sp. THAF82]QFT32601.1 Thiamine-phosphate synthase [Labrenzia sp. THAF82]
MKLDPFYLIVDSASWISRLVPLGVKLVQLRIKDADGDLLRSQIARSKAICAEYGCQLIVNDHWKLAIETGCDFVHLGQEDLAVADINAIRNAGLRLGVSTHDGAELDTALAVQPDYIALGPVFSTTTKELKWAPQGLEKISGWKQQIGGLPLVAIGGISLERLPGIFENGADSAAVISDITNSQDPETRVGDWISATASWRN